MPLGKIKDTVLVLKSVRKKSPPLEKIYALMSKYGRNYFSQVFIAKKKSCFVLEGPNISQLQDINMIIIFS